ncbi:hypothetical protein BB561_006757 [Smittium simulii]|uniref:NADH dehydrogenase [ubiquinone] 1 beta subcomplex subunit 4 n=1 Tax=Smittium simulii TaxID=133385 RepID=A0A2T9Y1R4_9FUNG|nr:hypothetical protein BB561_006757 [Smittium simulii]
MTKESHKTHLLKDPAIEKWADMRLEYRQNFRWTKKTASVGLIFGVIIPIALYYKIKQNRPELNERAASHLDKLDKTKWTSNN